MVNHITISIKHHTTKIQINIYNRCRQAKKSFLNDSSPVTTNTKVGQFRTSLFFKINALSFFKFYCHNSQV